MFNKKIMILTIILVSLFAVSTVSAADNTTSDIVSVEETTSDAVSVEETTSDAVSVDEADEVVSAENNQEILGNASDVGTFGELSDLIGNVSEGGILELDKDYQYVNGSNEGIEINKPITIDGKGHTLDGNNQSRIFQISNTNVLLKNIIFINGLTTDVGGAILMRGNNTVYNCTFVNCIANDPSNFYDEGGAIMISGAAIVDNCKFIDCYCTVQGGGAIRGYGPHITCSNCEFINCHSKMSGGAINFDLEYDFNINNCTFNNCFSYQGGGAIAGFIESIEDCKFINCHAPDGGAIGGYISSTVNCIFMNCYASKGGAICYYKSGNIENCIFDNNTAKIGNSIYGGGDYYDYDVLIIVKNSYFSKDEGNIESNEYCDVTLIKRNATFIGNLGTYYCGEGVNELPIFLKDLNNNSLCNQSIRIVFNQYSLNAITNEEGKVILSSKLQPQPSQWDINIIFDGNDNYYPTNLATILNFIPSPSSLNIKDVNTTLGHEITLIANVTSNNSLINEGSVSFFDGETYIGEANVNDGIATIIYSPTNAGEHIITGIYSTPYLVYSDSNDTAKVLVDSATIEVLVDYGTVGFESDFVANVKGLYSTINEGTVTFYINDEYLGQVNVVNGSANLTYTPFTVNDYTVKAVFSNSAKFLDDESTATYTVNPANSNVIINDLNGTVGHGLTIVANVVSSNNLTINEGIVTFYDGQTNIGEVNVVDGIAALTYAPTTAGEHNITAIFNSTNYLISNSTAKLLVDSATVDVLVDQGIVGFNSTFVAEVKGLYSTINEGSVAFYINDEYLGSAWVVNGLASINYIPLNANTYTVRVVFGDSDKFLNDEDSASYTVVPADSIIAINDMNGTVGHDIVISVNITSSNNLTVNEGYVVFFDGSTQIGESPVSDGVATFKYTPTTAGEHAITAMFYGTNYEDNINSALLNVSKANIDLSINNIAAVYFSNPSNFIVDVISNSHFVNEGNVKYYVNNRLIGSSHVYGGKSIYSYVTNGTGLFDLEVVFEESDNYLAKNVSATFWVDQMHTTLTGESVIFDEQDTKTFTTVLKDDNTNGVYNQTVKIEVIKYSGESASFTGVTDGNGITIYDVGKLAGGMWYVTGIYNGNGNYIGSSFADKFIVVRLETTTAIEEIDNPQVNHTYRIKANIHDEEGKLVKEGVVQFYLDGVYIGEVDLASHGPNSKGNEILGASNVMVEYVLGADGNEDLYLEYTPTKVGKYSLSAVYGGTTLYKSSNSTTTFNVGKSTVKSTVIVASNLATVYNSGQYLMITLKDQYGKAVSSVKVTVKFSNGKVLTATTDKIGRAKFSTNGLVPVKVYTATITFAGNSNYAKSSKIVKVTVKRANPKLIASAKAYKLRAVKKYTVALKTNRNVVMKNTLVTIKVGKITLNARTNAKGVATFNLAKLTKGNFVATVKFAGNKYYNAKTVNTKITVR